MELIVDANVIISALVATFGKTCELFFSDKLKLYAPEYLLEEIKNHGKEILDKSKLSKIDFEVILSLISSNIEFIPFSEFKSFISKASEVCPDPNDTEYFALALKLGCSVWSNDKKLKEQNLIKVLSTSEILKMFWRLFFFIFLP